MTSLSILRGSRSKPRFDDLAWWGAALAASVLTAGLTLISLQLALTVALVVLAIGTYVRSPSAGLALLWLVWLLTPGVRRVFGLLGPFTSADPLALAPFLVTGVLVAIQFARGGLSSTAMRIVLAGSAGWLIGLPLGLAEPEAMMFALLAYLAAVGAFVLGYHDPLRAGQGTFLRVLTVAAPLLAVYGFLQYFALPEWDRHWFDSTDFITASSPEKGHVRIWSTLNAPATFGAMLGLALVGYLISRRNDVLRLLGGAAVLTALTLTYVRSAWVSLAVAALALVVASRGRMAVRVAVVAALLAIGVPALAAGTSTGEAVIGRFGTLRELNSDTSAQERQQTALSVVPTALARPLGSGLGSAGEPSRLSQKVTFRFTDNAYLSLLYQVGPVGFLLVIGAAAAGLAQAWRLARQEGSGTVDLTIFGMLIFLAVGMLAGDLLFGITAIVFWYLLGLALRRREDLRLPATGRSGTG